MGDGVAGEQEQQCILHLVATNHLFGGGVFVAGIGYALVDACLNLLFSQIIIPVEEYRVHLNSSILFHAFDAVFPQLLAPGNGGVLRQQFVFAVGFSFEHVDVSIVALEVVERLEIVATEPFEILGNQICHVGVVEVNIFHLGQLFQHCLDFGVEHLSRQFDGVEVEIVGCGVAIIVGIALAETCAFGVHKGDFALGDVVFSDFLQQTVEILLALNEIAFVEVDGVFWLVAQHKEQEGMRGFAVSDGQTGFGKHIGESLQRLALGDVVVGVERGYGSLQCAIVQACDAVGAIFGAG